MYEYMPNNLRSFNSINIEREMKHNEKDINLMISFLKIFEFFFFTILIISNNTKKTQSFD